jgi:hypothetical protein
MILVRTALEGGYVACLTATGDDSAFVEVKPFTATARRLPRRRWSREKIDSSSDRKGDSLMNATTSILFIFTIVAAITALITAFANI